MLNTLDNEKMKAIRRIEDKYGLVTFRCGLSHMMDCGNRTLANAEDVQACKDGIMKAEEDREKGHGVPIMTAEFQCAIIDCAVELAKIPTWDLISYIKDYVACDGTKDHTVSLDCENEDDPDEDNEDDPEWVGSCPRCGYEMNSELTGEYDIKHCPECGQAIRY